MGKELPQFQSKAPLGVKADGGGNVRGQARVGNMKLWRATHNRDAAGELCSGVEQLHASSRERGNM